MRAECGGGIHADSALLALLESVPIRCMFGPPCAFQASLTTRSGGSPRILGSGAYGCSPQPAQDRLGQVWRRRYVVIARMVVLLMASVLAAVGGCTTPLPSVPAANQAPAASSSAAPGSAEALFVVDCLLPGQVRKLGKMTFLTARRPIKTSAQDCEMRGGAYVAYDRAD